jgi:PPOX class probable F420-dependent enzyme
LTEDVLWSPIDEKPKAVDDPRRLARIKDISRDPRVTLLVDRWSEDWADLAWLRIEGHAELVASVDAVVLALRSRYPQYADHDLAHRPMLRITIERATSWFASSS